MGHGGALLCHLEDCVGTASLMPFFIQDGSQNDAKRTTFPGTDEILNVKNKKIKSPCFSGNQILGKT